MRRLVLKASMLLILLAAVPRSAAANDIVGRASVVDGDTIEIRGERIRLHGIDAPESSQRCFLEPGRSWRCGRDSSMALAKLLGHQNVNCKGTKRDRYKRVIAECFLSERNINKWMVRRGWAVAYRRYSVDYVRDEQVAKKAVRGVWASRFVMPWDWRRGDRIQAISDTAAPVERK